MERSDAKNEAARHAPRNAEYPPFLAPSRSTVPKHPTSIPNAGLSLPASSRTTRGGMVQSSSRSFSRQRRGRGALGYCSGLRHSQLSPLDWRKPAQCRPRQGVQIRGLSENLKSQPVCHTMFFFTVSAAACTASLAFSLPVSKYSFPRSAAVSIASWPCSHRSSAVRRAYFPNRFRVLAPDSGAKSTATVAPIAMPVRSNKHASSALRFSICDSFHENWDCAQPHLSIERRVMLCLLPINNISQHASRDLPNCLHIGKPPTSGAKSF